MTRSRRRKATLLGVLAFVAALAIYLVTRPQDSLFAGRTAGSERSDVSWVASVRRWVAYLISPKSRLPSHVAGPACDRCTVENCIAGTDDGCDSLADAADRELCEKVYACFSNAKNACVIKGDPIPCWCGKNMTTCVTATSGPTQANGPCLQEIIAAAKTSDPNAIFRNFLNPELPLGHAARLTGCRGAFCPDDCQVR